MKKKSILLCLLVVLLLLPSCVQEDIILSSNSSEEDGFEERLSFPSALEPVVMSISPSTEAEQESSEKVACSEKTEDYEPYSDEGLSALQVATTHWTQLDVEFWRDAESGMLIVKILSDPFKDTLALMPEREQEGLQKLLVYLDSIDQYLNGTYEGPALFIPFGTTP